MSSPNLYWSVYSNLEKELLKLSEDIHFDDFQLGVYSVKICDLLVRSAVEIEAISKELYFNNGGVAIVDENGKERPPFFDTECIAHLESLWLLSKKQVLISATNFYFEKNENRVLTPLNNAYKRSGCGWCKAYQTVKHNRTYDITAMKRGKKPKGNLQHLIHAMAALYLLNVYYKNETFSLKKDKNATDFPIGLGSEIFSVKKHKSGSYSIDGGQIAPDFDECIYLIKYTDEYFDKFKQGMLMLQQNTNNAFIKHPKVLEYLKTSGIESLKDYQGNLFLDILGIDEYKKVMQSVHQDTRFLQNAEYEAILNKGKIH